MQPKTRSIDKSEDRTTKEVTVAREVVFRGVITIDSLLPKKGYFLPSII